MPRHRAQITDELVGLFTDHAAPGEVLDDALQQAPEIVQQRKPSRKVLERLEQIQSLPRRKQDAILTTIDHFLRSATG